MAAGSGSGWEGCALVVPAGGAGRRMAAADPDVPDKLAAALGASTVLGELLARVAAGVPVVVVGPQRGELGPSVLLAREDPAGGGPAAAVAAGVAALGAAGALAPPHAGADGSRGADVVVVCAGDAPWAPLAVPALVAALRAAPPSVPAAVAVDASGAAQPLLAAHRASALLERLAGTDPAGRAAGWLLGRDTVRVVVPVGSTDDVDTPEHLERARRRAGGD